MSDSDDNLTQHNMIENENTILRGQGSFFNQRFKNLASSTHTSVLQNFNSGYGFNHRSMLPINRRETSPMSLRSVPDFGHNYENSYYSRGRTCESVINGRSQSPGSVGSMDSTTSAAYVVQIFKNIKFNKYDKRIVHEAYNKYVRHRDRRRVSKRRKLKLFIKRNRRKSDDSGDEGSNSSMSSDDNRSVRSAIPKESVLKPNYRSNRAEILNFRESIKKNDMYTDCTENIIRNSSLKNMFYDHCAKPTHKLLNNVGDTRKDCSDINPIPQETVNRFQSNTGTQRDRFTKGFSLPSERFHRSVMRPTSNRNMPYNLEKKSQNNPRSDGSDSDDDIIPNQTVLSVNNTSRKRMLENQETTMLSSEKRNKLSCGVPLTNPDDTTFKKPLMPVRRPIKSKANFLSGPVSSKSKYPLLGFLSRSMNKDSDNNLNSTKKPNETISEGVSVQKCVDNQEPIDSDSDDIFTNTQKQNQPDNKDRNDNKISPQNKRIQATPANGKKRKNQKNLPDKRPQAKNKEKLSPIENTTEEILISKSKQPLIGNVEVINPVTSSEKLATKHTNNEKGSENNSDNPLSVTDMSMKPSFIKRKLFTQKLDIADDKNDSLVAKSPHPTTYKLREKNKVRKLATSQSCLSRDIAGGDNMILDLIHKIVPANQMNMTSANHKTRNSQENEDRWDVTSVISMCNKTVESDTYTDEDIFQEPEQGPTNKEKTQKNKTNKIYEKQKENVNIQKNAAPVQEIFYTNDITTSGTNKRTAAKCANAFWDTDFETDLEDSMRLPMRSPARNIVRKKEKEAQNKENIQKSNIADSKPNNLQNMINLTTNCKVQLVKQKDDIIVTKLSEKKGNSVKKGSSPKKGKCVEMKEENNANKVTKQNKSTKLSQKNGKSPPKQDKHAETKVNNAKKESKESKLTKSTDKKRELVKKASPQKKDKENKIRTSPRTPKLGVKYVTKNGDTKLKNETKRQPKNSTKKVLQENKIISTIKTRKQKSFLNDSLNSSCERSIFTRSFTLQNKQRLL